MKYHKYSFRKYDPNLPKLFEKEKTKLKKIVQRDAHIEHIGSTSVPGLGGKGIIDIAIGVAKKDFTENIKRLEKKGFKYKTHPGDDKRKFLEKIIKYKGKERRIHIHLTSYRGDFWNSFIALRDYLCKNEKACDKYAQIKKEASKHAKNDGKKYMEHKIKFLKETVKKALEKKR